jgi:hypothetical protein
MENLADTMRPGEVKDVRSSNAQVFHQELFPASHKACDTVSHFEEADPVQSSTTSEV